MTMALKVVLLSIVLSVLLSGTTGQSDPERPIEIAFSFDTTGSMYPVLEQVREVVADMIARLQSDIPGIRLAVFAHGDYSDASATYDAIHVDFTSNSDTLQDFVRNAARTGGGDLPEAYELVLRQVHTELSWTPGSQRSLIMIGDNMPHPPERNPYQIDWEEEADVLNHLGIRIYSIKALEYNAGRFYREIANRTGGYFLELENFNSIFDFIMAISYREYGLVFLQSYEEEVRARPGGITPELAALFQTLMNNPDSFDRSQRPSRPVTSHPPVTTTTLPPTLPPITYNKMMKIYSLEIVSEIAYRMATTTVSSKLSNRGDNATEATFSVTLPDAAFISNFSMTIEGVEYPGEVKEKETARRIYEAARSRGESAGHVVASPRNSNKFKVKVNIAGGKKVMFHLTYQEVLERRLGIYEHVIHIDPGQIVEDFRVEVNIRESRPITTLHVPPLRNDLLNAISNTDGNPLAEITRVSDNGADIVFSPTEDDQMEASEQGVRGQFVVQYDVERPEIAGELQVVDGYFVHFFAPEGLPPVHKKVIFVLDTSGSMKGNKLRQLKDAMITILDQLRPGDHFNILGFSSFFRNWEDGLVPVNTENIENAKDWIWAMFPAGGTDINGAALQGLDQLVESQHNQTNVADATMMVFLTDGMPTHGETNKNTILENIRQANNDRFSLFSLGFGDKQTVDFSLLQKMSLQNRGFSRRIYADSDADLQLQGFFDEISSPVLSQVQISYLGGVVNDSLLTTTQHGCYFDGSEFIVAGILNDPNLRTLNSQVHANAIDGPVDYNIQSTEPVTDVELPSGESRGDYFERLWAYLTIKELLKKRDQAIDSTVKDELSQQALNMSLKYHFVTPLTSMVVTKPEDEEEEEGEGESPTPSPDTSVHETDTADEALDEALHAPPPMPGGRGVSRYSGRRYSSSGGRGGEGYADNDPHFMVNLEGSETPICFDVMGKPGDIFQLIHDPVQDITINGFIVGKNDSSIPVKDRKTYFGKIAVIHGDTRVVLLPKGLRVQNTPHKWVFNTTVTHGDVMLQFLNRHKVLVTIGNRVSIMVIRHNVKPGTSKVDFLGIYIENGDGFTRDVHGLLGQFQSVSVVVEEIPGLVGNKTTATLSFPDAKHRRSLKVFKGGRRNMATKEYQPCWFVRHNGHRLIDGRVQNYKVKHLMYSQFAPGLKKNLLLEDYIIKNN